jgi:DNA adenine methylase
LLPRTKHYIEPFGGSAAVLLNRDPSQIETFNDLSSDVVNFFKVLRQWPEELMEAVSFSPWSREEFGEAIATCKAPLARDAGKAERLERARSFYLKTLQGYMGKEDITPSQWTHHVKAISDNSCSKAYTWLTKPGKLLRVAKRMMRVQIEHRPALWLIEHYDAPEALFYCDPPYLMKSRTAGKCYNHEMTESDFEALAGALNECKAKVALSAYDHPKINELFPPDKWLVSKECLKPVHGGVWRQECLYTNYDPNLINGGLFKC